MKARTPKSYLNLPKHEKEIIQRLQEEAVENEVNRNFAKLQKNWLKLSCIVLSEFCGNSVEELLLYLGNFHEIYRINATLKTNEEQQKWLDEKMDAIFGVGGFPQKYLDKLENL